MLPSGHSEALRHVRSLSAGSNLRSNYAALRHLASLGPAGVSRCMLSLQRQYGNRCVQRVLALSTHQTGAREITAENKSGSGRKPGGVQQGHGIGIAGSRVVQRLTAEERQEDLQSQKYAGNTRLEAAFDNNPAIHIGEANDGVRLVQEGLVADGLPMPVSTKPTGEMDGEFGPETLATVKQFQANHNLTVDGAIGRETLGELDQEALGGGGGGSDNKCTCPPGTEPGGSTDLRPANVSAFDGNGLELPGLAPLGGGNSARQCPICQPVGPSNGPAACPVSAQLSSFAVGLGQGKGCNVNCRPASGNSGTGRLAHFRLTGLPQTATNVTVGEQFKTLEENPQGIGGLLQPASNSAVNGFFDDCYCIESKNPLPPDFRLKVEQNHLMNGAILDKNQIIFSADGIRFCHFDRQRGSCNFGGRCKL